MTIWIAQNKADKDWLMAFETNPTMDDLQRAAKGRAGERREWDVYGHTVYATIAGKRKRKGWADAAKTLEKATQ